MIEVKDLSQDNLNDIFQVCKGVADAFNIPENDFVIKGKEKRIKWLKSMLNEYGPCTKIAYIDGKPVAQLLYYPEKAMRYIKNRRENVIHIQCIVSPFPETQRLGVGSALLSKLIDECRQGIEILDWEKCSYLVAYPFPSVIGIPFSEFYFKMGFNQGEDEYYKEISSRYYPRKKEEYIPLIEDKDKVILFYNPTCEFGFYYVNAVKKVLEENFENLPVKIFNVWEDYEEYLKRPQQTIVVGRATVNQQTVNDFLFWEDVDAWLIEIRDRLEHGL